MTCDNLGLFADGELSAADADAFRQHLTSCEDCRSGLRDWTAIAARLSTLPRFGDAARQPQWDRRFEDSVAQLGADALPPVDFEERVLARINAEADRARRADARWRRAKLAIIVASVTPFVALLAALLTGCGKPEPESADLAAFEAAMRLSARLEQCQRDRQQVLDPAVSTNPLAVEIALASPECSEPPGSRSCIAAIDRISCRCLGAWSRWSVCSLAGYGLDRSDWGFPW